MAETDNYFRHNMYMYILYLMCEEAILAFLCTGLPITTTVDSEWLNGLVFHENTKSITANGLMMIYVATSMTIVFA